jgi:dolichol kinase
MNLENYNVQEMNAKELKTTDGGILGIVAALIASCVCPTSRWSLPAMAAASGSGGTTIGNIGGAKWYNNSKSVKGSLVIDYQASLL